MAQRAVAITRSLPVILTAALVLGLTLGTLAAVLGRAEGFGGVRSADWAAIRFTVTQASGKQQSTKYCRPLTPIPAEHKHATRANVCHNSWVH